DAVVTLNNVMATTDAYGNFYYKNASLNALGALVRVDKDGFFQGSRRFFPKANQENRVQIQLLEKTIVGSFQTNTGGKIDIGNASVDFDPSSIRLENGDAYSGEVMVAAKWLDPSIAITLDQMPGNLIGVNAEVEEVALSTYGMIAVELEGSNGEALNIVNDQTAQISMNVPANLLASAPNEIPLWSYNEQYGIWVEEGKATLQNNQYVGEVSHFSFWNCDVPADMVELSLSLEDGNGTPLANHKVRLSLSSNASTCSGYTDSDGNISGFVHKDEAITLEVLDVCQNVIYTDQIGPFSSDTDLGTITVTGSTANNTSISGTLVDCSGNPVNNGAIVVEYSGRVFSYNLTDADFDISFTTCDAVSSVSLTGVNIDNEEQGATIDVTPNAQND
ncbi:MAG: hypothetical protein AAGK97_16490, partial [Bacteroidota bacterium]